MNLINIYICIFCYLDFISDNTSLRYLKLVIAILNTPQSILYLIRLLKTGRWIFKYCLNSIIEELTSNYLSQNYLYYYKYIQEMFYQDYNNEILSIINFLNTNYNLKIKEKLIKTLIIYFMGCNNGIYCLKEKFYAKIVNINKSRLFEYQDYYKTDITLDEIMLKNEITMTFREKIYANNEKKYQYLISKNKYYIDDCDDSVENFINIEDNENNLLFYTKLHKVNEDFENMFSITYEITNNKTNHHLHLDNKSLDIFENCNCSNKNIIYYLNIYSVCEYKKIKNAIIGN